jgi:hypothetical protein
MRVAVISYRDATLEACERDDVWTVRRANLQASARYLDSALAEVLGNAREAHRAAARLVAELTDVVVRQDVADQGTVSSARSGQLTGVRRKAAARPLLLPFRVLAFAVVAGTAFVLTTWLTTLR